MIRRIRRGSLEVRLPSSKSFWHKSVGMLGRASSCSEAPGSSLFPQIKSGKLITSSHQTPSRSEAGVFYDRIPKIINVYVSLRKNVQTVTLIGRKTLAAALQACIIQHTELSATTS